VLLIDAAAAFAIGRCLLYGEPMSRVPLGLYDGATGRTHVVSAPVGLPLRDALGQLGVDPAGLVLRGGSPMRDVRLTPDCVVAGGESCVYAIGRPPDVNPDPCIRCAWCVQACPVRIHPAGILEAAQRVDLERAKDYGLEACIECGICSFVCPSKLPLLAAIRTFRK
jgi:electron transport complex protein RnfC